MPCHLVAAGYGPAGGGGPSMPSGVPSRPTPVAVVVVVMEIHPNPNFTNDRTWVRVGPFRIPTPGDPDGCRSGHPGSLRPPPEAWPGPPALALPRYWPPAAGRGPASCGGRDARGRGRAALDRSGLEDDLPRDAPRRLGHEGLPGVGERVHRTDLRPELTGVDQAGELQELGAAGLADEVERPDVVAVAGRRGADRDEGATRLDHRR